MISFTIKQICDVIAGTPYGVSKLDIAIDAISTDSRKIEKNALFVALVGESFDGHGFVTHAINDGALAVIVDRKLDGDIPQIVVSNTRKALGEIAAYVRCQVPTKIVALTGSSGKTSVKEMTATILSHCGQTLHTQGNFNNDIGVPLTLFRLTEQDKFAVIELGANHIGEIAYTTKLVKPQTALINNIAEAHIEGFGSLAGVAQAKGEIFQGLPDGGVAIINLDSHSKAWYSLLESKVIWTFALQNNTADFYASNIQLGMITTFMLNTPKGEIRIDLPLAGHHNISNAIAASALAMSVGASLDDIKSGLMSLKPIKGRLFPIKLNNSQLIWDDSYNANVGSMTAAIQVLAGQPGYKVFVVGDMAELGADAEQYHQQIGKLAKEMELDCVVSIGMLSKAISEFSGKGHHFNDKQSAVAFLTQLLREHTQLTMLVKGSRSAKMEELIDSIKMSNLK